MEAKFHIGEKVFTKVGNKKYKLKIDSIQFIENDSFYEMFGVKFEPSFFYRTKDLPNYLIRECDLFQ
jgi:hypothetical protein